MANISKDFQYDINLVDSKIRNTMIGDLATDPTGLTSDDAGLMWFNTTDSILKYYTGTEIMPVLYNAGGVHLKGDIDCSANPDYPSGVIGDMYYVSVAGKIGGASGEAVDIGDQVICKTDNAGGDEATVGDDWFVIQANIQQATETLAGIMRIATQAEVTTGTDDTIAVTPLKLKTAGYSKRQSVVLDSSNADIARTFATGVTTWVFTHGLGVKNILAQTYEVSGDGQNETRIEYTSINTISVKVNGDKADGLFGLIYS